MAQPRMQMNLGESLIKSWSWILVPIIAVGGLFLPKLGLLLLPIMITLIGIGFFTGKYWCGRLCPHGSLFDTILAPFAAVRNMPALLKSPLWKFAFFAFFMTMFSLRLATAVRAWGTLDFWDKLGFVFAFNYLMPTIIGIALALLIRPRAWCSFCPMGVMQEGAHKLGHVTGLNKNFDHAVVISSLAKCVSCGKCAKACPMELIPYKHFSAEGIFSDPACIKCGACVSACPLNLLSIQRKTAVASCVACTK